MLRKMALVIALGLTGVLTAQAADVTGRWTAQVETPRGVQHITLDLKVDGDKLRGTITTERGFTTLTDCALDNDALTFTQLLNYGGNEFRVEYKGELVEPDSIDFVRKVRGMPAVEFTAKRAGSSDEY